MYTKKIINIKKDSYIDSLGYLDENFILFFPDTKFNYQIKNIFNEHLILEYKIDEYESNLSKTNTYISTDTNEPENTKNIPSNIQSIQKNKSNTNNRYINLLFLYPKYELKYTELYHQLKTIVHNISIEQKLNYKDILNFMYDKILPIVKEEPLIYLAAHEFYVNEKHIQCKLINFFLQNLLLSTALLECDTSKTFISIEKKIQLSISSMLTNIGLITTLNIIEKEEIISMLFTPQLRKTIPKLSNKLLEHFVFPFNLTQGILHSKESYVNLQKLQIKNVFTVSPSSVYQFSFIINSYIFLIGGYNKKVYDPPHALKMIIQQANKEFNPEFVKIIVNILGTIPPGTYVSLNNETKGMIIFPSIAPDRTPVMQILSTKHNNNINDIQAISIDSNEFSINNILSETETQQLRSHRKYLMYKK